MNKTYSIYNSLIFRRLLPPPISACNVNNTQTSLVLAPLLHQASAFCGRAFLFLCLILPTPLLCSCERESITSEADSLTRTAADTTANDDGLLHIGNIAIDTAWAGETHINY